jgi:hypothetical protein
MACFTCGIVEPNNEEFEIVCSDCSVIMCNTCKYNDNNLCGCYGRCDSCNCEVDRGSDGWKCMDCQEWLCNNCKMESECSRCGRGVDSSEDNNYNYDSYYLTPEDLIMGVYFKSDEWCKYIDYIQDLYHNNKGIIQNMKEKITEIQDENSKIKQQIEELEERMTINNYLLEHIFNDNILLEGNNDKIFKNIIAQSKKYLDTNDEL